MLSFSKLLLIASGLVFVSAQTIDLPSVLPPCALDCAKKAAQRASCDLKDTKCLCASRTFASDLLTCTRANCPPKDLAIVTEILEKLCDGGPFSSLTKCAYNCVTKATERAGCKLGDLKCLCASPTFYEDVIKCVGVNCPRDVVPTQELLKKLCDGL